MVPVLLIAAAHELGFSRNISLVDVQESSHAACRLQGYMICRCCDRFSRRMQPANTSISKGYHHHASHLIIITVIVMDIILTAWMLAAITIHSCYTCSSAALATHSVADFIPWKVSSMAADLLSQLEVACASDFSLRHVHVLLL